MGYFTALLLLSIVVSSFGAQYRRVCYHSNWSQYRPAPAKFFPESIDPFLCTHICYAFAKLNGNHLKAFEWNDESEPWMKGMYERFNALKQKNPKLKTILSVGGWNMGSAPFTRMVASAASRQDFIQHAIGFLRKRNFDGVDLDWEYPANRGSPPGDRAKFTALVRETRLGFEADSKKTGNPRLLVTSAVSAGKDKIDTGYDIPTISQYFDFITIMTYDLHGAWEKFTGHNSPLFSRSDETGLQKNLNMAWAANYWVSKGAPKDKLNIGLALYGRGFTLVDKTNTKPGAPNKGPCNKGRFTREAGFLAYYEICEMIKSGGKVTWIKEQEVPFVVKGDQWVGYDNQKSLTIKVNWIKQNNFGGIATWALPLDDFGNQCGEGKYPLMNAIVKTLGGSVIPTFTDAPTNPPTPKVTLGKVTVDKLCMGHADGMYAHPESCTKYVICAGGSAFVDTCASGTMWNDMKKYCDYDPHMKCVKNGKVFTNSPVTQPPQHHSTKTGVTSGKVNGKFCDNQPDGLYKDPQSCSMYYQCASGLTFHENCPPGTAWNQAIKACDFPNHVPGC